MNRSNKVAYLLIVLLFGVGSCRPVPTPGAIPVTPSGKAETYVMTPTQTETDTPVISATEGLAWLQSTSTGVQFEKADRIRDFSFPADHGAHPTFQTEWWYFTGNLQAEDGSRFGYELTFFRRGLSPVSMDRSSKWAAFNIYMAHFAITDVEGNQFHADQRFSRDGGQLAGASADPFARIWLEDWVARQTGSNVWELAAKNDQMSLSLQMSDLKGPVLQGDRGLSRKNEGSASYYYSLTRLESTGAIEIDGQKYTVQGDSWMDHEFSTSALAPDQVGWDWFALQLDDGSDLMLYTLRKEDGSLDPYSSASLIGQDAMVELLALSDFKVDTTGTWTSSHSQAQYPSGWKISIPSRQIELIVTPLIPDQELNLSFIYWEGAVQVKGTIAGQPVTGRGYVELTGYVQSMQGEF